ncbi:MAG: DMT family transporter, partial [Proteobacteria bacterium]|nr:DMT family transporter [Pseudomonadota bacterium]
MSKHENFSPSPALAYVLLTYAAFLWGASTVVGRGVHEIIPPIGLSFWRGLAAAAILLPFVFGDLSRKWPMIKENWRWLLFLGIAQVWPQAAFLLSVNFTTAINATLVNASQPAITAVVAFILLRDKLLLR